MKRPTTYCDSCESVVYADDVHSCYDAKAVRHDKAVQDAREAVVQAAVVLRSLASPDGPHGLDGEQWVQACGDASDALNAAVDHLLALTSTSTEHG